MSEIYSAPNVFQFQKSSLLMQLGFRGLDVTFNDVLLVPQYSDINSRTEVDISTQLTRNTKFGISIPIVAANMDTVCGYDMIKVMNKLGGCGILHRYMSSTEQLAIIDKLKQENIFPVCAAVGVKNIEEHVVKLIECGIDVLLVDVAHGHHRLVADAIKLIKELVDNKFVQIIAGNVATAEGAMFLEDCGVDAIKVGVGSGCLASGTRILMSNGTYKNIEDIKVHDRIINGEGKIVEVIGIRFSGIKKIINLRNNIFYKELALTEDHRLLVGDLNSCKESAKVSGYRKVLSVPDRPSLFSSIYGNNKIKWKPAVDTKGCVLLSPLKIDFDMPDTFNLTISDFILARRSMVGLNEDRKLILYPSYDLGYIFGTYLGDGTTALYNNFRGVKKHRNICACTYWSFNLKEEEIANKLILALKNVFKVNPKKEIKPHKKIIQVIVRNNFISRLFNEFGKHTNKTLPTKYWCKDIDYISGILEGLIDSDGTIEADGRTRFSSTSAQLIEQLNILNFILTGSFPLNSCLGKTPFAGNRNIDISNYNNSYSVTLLKRPEYRKLNNYQIVKILANKENNTTLEVPTYDIEVSGNSPTFIANNIIVHNSICTTRLVTGHGMPQLGAIAAVCERSSLPIIADGGIRHSGDIVKALGAGASSVMLGYLLAGTDESPGEVFVNGAGRKVKGYRGLASRQAQQDFFGNAPDAPEGISTYVDYRGPVTDIIKELVGGIKSGLSYSGVRNIKELQLNAYWELMSKSTWEESLTI